MGRTVTGFNLNIAADPTGRWPSIRAHCGRVNVILGANGTGKSNLLMQMRVQKVLPTRECCPVEGGRVLKPPPTLKMSPKNFNQFSSVATSRKNWQGYPTLADRLQSSFMVLVAEDKEARNAHSEAVTEWQANGSPTGRCPVVQASRLEQLFRLFEELFPEITVTVMDGRLYCEKNGRSYQAQGLSDGERQVLGLLADVLLAAPSDSFVIVDEPELNLHTQLAIDLWSLVERELPDAVFVYATHNIQFAARQSVDKIIVLSGGDGEHLVVDNGWDIPPQTLPTFLGSAATILRAKHALLTEGTKRSFDVPFYQWLVTDRSRLVLPIGGCGDVVGAVAHQEPWNRLVSGTNVSGVIDRDYRPGAELERYADKGCVVLALHEAESYLAHPEIIKDLATRVGLVDEPPTILELESQIRSFARSVRLEVVARRTFNRIGIRLGPSISGRELGELTSESDLRTNLANGAAAELQKASELMAPPAVNRVVQEELDRFEAALTGDILALLALVPGKELLYQCLIKTTGCGCPSQFLVGVRNHLSPDDYTHTAALAAALRAPRA